MIIIPSWPPLSYRPHLNRWWPAVNGSSLTKFIEIWTKMENFLFKKCILICHLSTYVEQCGKTADSFDFRCFYTKPSSHCVLRSCGALSLPTSVCLCPPACPYDLACPRENSRIIRSIQTQSIVDPQGNLSYLRSGCNFCTVYWYAVGCEWCTTSVYFGTFALSL